jgi:hypothetical protein
MRGKDPKLDIAVGTVFNHGSADLSFFIQSSLAPIITVKGIKSINLFIFEVVDSPVSPI